MLNISFNKNVELIFGLMYSINKDYRLDPKSFFTDTIPSYCKEFYDLYKENIDSKLIEYIRNGGLDTYNRSAEIAMSLDNDYNIVEDEYIEAIKRNNANFDKEKLELLLKAFVKRANYDNFYLKHKDFYNYLINKYREALNKFVNFDESLLVNFYGYKKGKMSIVLYNFTQGSFGYHNSLDMINIRCVQNISKDENNIEFSPNSIINCFHEFSHPYMNPLGYKYFKDIDLSNLFEEAKINGLQFFYNNSLVVINEYMVRAVQIYLGNKYMDKDYMKRHIKYNKSVGYKYIEDVAKLFDKKTKYSNFEEFYKNEIVVFFITLNEKLKTGMTEKIKHI